MIVVPHERRHYIFIRFCEVPMEAAILFAGSRLARPKTSSSLGLVSLMCLYATLLTTSNNLRSKLTNFVYL